MEHTHTHSTKAKKFLLLCCMNAPSYVLSPAPISLEWNYLHPHTRCSQLFKKQRLKNKLYLRLLIICQAFEYYTRDFIFIDCVLFLKISFLNIVFLPLTNFVHGNGIFICIYYLIRFLVLNCWQFAYKGLTQNCLKNWCLNFRNGIV